MASHTSVEDILFGLDVAIFKMLAAFEIFR